MTFQWRISIRSKILLVLSAVMISAVALYLYLASRIFFEDKTLLIYELNQTNVKTLGSDVEIQIKGILNALRIWGLHGDPGFDPGDGLVDISILEKSRSGQLTARVLKFWPRSLGLFGKDEAYLQRIRARYPVPFDRIARKGTWVRNTTLTPQSGSDEIPPLLTVATAIQRDGKPAVIYADLRLNRILEDFSRSGIAEVDLVDSEGYALASSDHQKVLQPLSLSDAPLVQAALKSKVRSEVKRFISGGVDYLGSFYRMDTADLVVVSKVEFQEAFSAARTLVRKSLLYALMVVTAAFLIALFFSYSLTVPIQRMVEATKQIAQGNFNLLVPISTRDELAILASSFNSMTGDLRASRRQLEEYNRDLEKKVAERTVAIREAQEALVRTTRLASVGEIAGRAAHEVLNPLTNISARLEKVRNMGIKEEVGDLTLMKQIVEGWHRELKEKGPEGLLKSLTAPSSAQPGKTLLEEDLANLAAITADSANRLRQRATDIEFLLKESGRIGKIVNGMRQLTRVSGARRPLAIHEVIDEAFDAMADLFAKNSVRIERGYCHGDPRIFADHDELLQVFSNLFRNSLQAIQEARRSGSPTGSPAKVWVTTQILSSPRGARVMIRVCDNGPGIPEPNFQNVFEPTFTTKSLEEGTGLGLSICRRFLRALEGEITVEKSAPGAETALLIDVPEWTDKSHG